MRNGGAEDSAEETLAGGGSTTVTRVGVTVRRTAQPWSSTVGAMLSALRAVGFEGAPAFHGFDDRGREVLDFIPGDVGNYPLTQDVRSEIAADSAAGLLRRFHDASALLVDALPADWQSAALDPVEVICHGDFAPYNCVFRGDRVVGIIDFDTARPGPRAWDLAYAIYRFAPLADPQHNPDAFGDEAEQVARAHRFLDSYGASPDLRWTAIGMLQPRLRALIDHIERSAAAGAEAARRHLADGHVEVYLADLAHIAAMMPALLAPRATG